MNFSKTDIRNFNDIEVAKMVKRLSKMLVAEDYFLDDVPETYKAS